MQKNEKRLIFLTGFLTFFFGFGAGALLNIYLISVRSPLVANLRSSLSFKSSIYGDGILLPVTNMFIVYFLIKNKRFINKYRVALSLLASFIVTGYFHVAQAVGGLVNWAMPKPWQWNFMGAWHGAYMFSVISLISLFYVVVFALFLRKRKIYWEFFLVSFVILLFFLLLKLDYSTVNISDILPWKL